MIFFCIIYTYLQTLFDVSFQRLKALDDGWQDLQKMWYNKEQLLSQALNLQVLLTELNIFGFDLILFMHMKIFKFYLHLIYFI